MRTEKLFINTDIRLFDLLKYKNLGSNAIQDPRPQKKICLTFLLLICDPQDVSLGVLE